MSDYLVGSWKALCDIQTVVGVTTLTIPNRSIVTVRQVDRERIKVLVEVGLNIIDWMPYTFLYNFERID